LTIKGCQTPPDVPIGDTGSAWEAVMLDAVMGMVAEGFLPAVAGWGMIYNLKYLWEVHNAEN
jgi:hypothetical protein